MRQYFDSPLADGLVTPQAAVSPAVATTNLLTTQQANKYLPLPYGQNSPSPGQVFKVTVGGLCTTVATTSGVTFTIYHGPGAGATSFGTALAASSALTTVAATAGNWLLEGILTYRSISELSTASTAWFIGKITINGPSSGTVATVVGLIQSTAAVSVDTTGLAASGLFGALSLSVLDTTTGSTWTTEFGFIESLN
jgi:hypothetical protein